jgi:hypothetical protein
MMAVDGGEWFDSMWVLWPIAEIVEQNRFYRAANEEGNNPRDFRALGFFAGAGCDGNLFGFPVADNLACEPSVVAWWPILDELEGVASTLDDFLKGWLTGGIAV